MILTLMSLVNMFGGGPTPTQHNVPDTYVEEKGGYGEKLKKEQDEGTRKVIKDDEEILLLIAQWIAEENSN